jgi:TnpA family transposase
MPLLTILNTQDKKIFDAPPVFNSRERRRFFGYFPTDILKIAEELRTPTTKVCFLTVYGYFKATNKFFNRQFRKEDIEYVVRKCGLENETIDTKTYEESIYRYHKTKILHFCGIKKFDSQAQSIIKKEISTMVRSQIKPGYIFQHVIDILLRNKIEVPGYFPIALLISKTILLYKQDLEKIIGKHLSPQNKSLLDSLLEREQNNEEEKFQRYKLTILKKFHQSTKPMKVKANTEDLATLGNLFHRLEEVFKAVNLSDEGIRYFAQFVLQSRTHQMLQKSKNSRYLYTIAFISHQYFKLQDGLLDTLLKVVQHAINKAQEQEKTAYFEKREEAALQKKQLLSAIGDIRTIINVEGSAEEKLKQIDVLLKSLEKQIQSQEQPDTPYVFLEAGSLKLQKRVSDIIRQVEFNQDTSGKNLIEAIRYFKKKDGDIDKHAPMDFLGEKEKSLVFNKETFKISLYKTLLFKTIADGVKAGTMNLRYSYKYRSLNEYLIAKDSWKKHKTEYIERAKLEEFVDVDQVLTKLSADLSSQYENTNTAILQGENKYIKFHHDTFSLTTPPEDTTGGELSLGDLFPRNKYVSLLEVLSTINTASGFLDSLQHFQNTHLHPRPANSTFFAGIIGLGCNIGLRRLVQTAPLINESELDTATSWYFSLENINNANDAIGSLMNTLDLPNIYRRNQGLLHTSNDGQKYNAAHDSLNAGASYKYFGNGEGSSILNFIDERHILFHGDVINENEREAPYVIDGLTHDNVLKSDMHSADSHGFNELIFGATHLLGHPFAPRLKGIARQQRYSFERIKTYDKQGFKILPHKYANSEVIKENWDDLLRLICTIKLKYTPASQIFKRLNSYSKQHRLYQALKAFGQIIKTLFILKYIDDVEFRQAIEKQLNKGEHSNRFGKAVYYGHNQEIIQATKEEQQKAEACKRLIQNAIICWNYLYLSKKIIDEQNPQKRNILLLTIKSGSPITWSHIILHGEFDFSENKLKDSIGFSLHDILELKVSKN